MIGFENEFFRAAVDPCGAELRSLFCKRTGQERIWSADPEVWGSSAPVLFPIVGKLKDGRTRIDGEWFSIPKHGLIRGRDADTKEIEKDRLQLQFLSNSETRKHFPFDFLFSVNFQLMENGLKVSYRVENPGEKPLLFTLGSHPAFALDLDLGPLSAYTVAFDQPENLDLYGLGEEGMVRMQEHYLQNATRIPLSDQLFDGDALIFRDIRSQVLQISGPEGFDRLELHTGGAPHLGIWAKPAAPFVCLEPWYGFDDEVGASSEFAEKPGIQTLNPGAVFESGYRIVV